MVSAWQTHMLTELNQTVNKKLQKVVQQKCQRRLVKEFVVRLVATTFGDVARQDFCCTRKLRSKVCKKMWHQLNVLPLIIIIHAIVTLHRVHHALVVVHLSVVECFSHFLWCRAISFVGNWYESWYQPTILSLRHSKDPSFWSVIVMVR